MTGTVTRVLAINSGSSSLKAAVYEIGDAESQRLGIRVNRIGRGGCRLRVVDGQGTCLVDREADLADHGAALDAVLGWLDREPAALRPDVVAHRIVHGGARYREPTLLSSEVVVALETLVPVDPDHLPQAIAGIRAIERAYPGLRQVGCFDTGFHRDLPLAARTYALPRQLTAAGMVRYGFHGLSYEYVMDQLRRLDPASAAGRVIVAHLGNGASMAAVRGGRSIDTTMGFSPTAGLVMGTRSGDLDPGLLLYMVREQRLTPADAGELINRQAGLLGVSATTEDMGELLACEGEDPRAAEAVELFCYQAKRYLGAYAAVLGGLDVLVFTAGIGEHAAPVRERICAGLDFLGLELDPGRNSRHEPVISADRSRVCVRVIATNEELMAARHACRLVARGTTP
ncbi:MAG TPA: acetate/propionate family kinase [Gemmatimonadales bacterium]|nr:acetate/propionate family kinase [Gemmatimonadales bacterium]